METRAACNRCRELARLLWKTSLGSQRVGPRPVAPCHWTTEELRGQEVKGIVVDYREGALPAGTACAARSLAPQGMAECCDVESDR